PPRLRFPLRRQLAAVRVDVTQPVVRFVFDQDQLRRLDDLARLRLLVKLKEPHRQAVGVRILLRFEVQPLLPEIRGPRRVRQAIGHFPAGFEEGGHWRPTRVERKALGQRLDWNATSAAATLATLRTLSTGGTLCTLSTWCALPSAARRSTVGAHPDARQIGLAVGGARSRRIHEHLALGITRYIRGGEVRPLRADRNRRGCYQSDGAVHCIFHRSSY